MNIEENKISFEVEGIKTIFKKQKIDLYSNNINLLLGLNSSGKTSFLEAVTFLRRNNLDLRTKFLRDIKGSEKINFAIQKEEDIVSRVFINYNFSEKELKILENSLNYLFPKSLKDKYMNIFRNEGRKVGVDSNNNYLHALDNNSIYKKIIFEYLKNPNNEDFYKNFYQEFRDYNVGLKTQKLLEKIFNKIKRVISYAKSKGRFELTSEIAYLNIDNTKIYLKTEFIFRVFLNIEKILIKKPEIVYLKNNSRINDLEYNFDLNYLFERINTGEAFSEKARINDILNFLYPEKEQLKFYYEMPNGNEKNEEKSKIEEKIRNNLKKVLQNFEFIDFEIKINITNNQIKLQFNSKGDWLIGSNESKNNSNGAKVFLDFIITLNSIIHDNSNDQIKIIMVDEPENNLSIPLQIELKKYLKNLIAKNKELFKSIYIIFATHSPFLYDSQFKINIFERDQIGSTKILSLEKGLHSIKDDIEKIDTLKLLEMIFAIENYLKQEFEQNIFKQPKKILYYNSDRDFLPNKIYEIHFELRAINSLASLYQMIGEMGLRNFEQIRHDDYLEEKQIKELVSKMETENKKFAVILIN
ncbi:MAG: hypothetical protein HPPSJP_5260 [Candidatus Hepatoplasma scabrum]|nr:MAG: hypothetical protein HPPSJP_5260 [Candidatus Hepatoplasma sp.]